MKFFKRKDDSSAIISQVVILAMIFGFSSGVVGQIVADVYLDPWKQDYVLSDLTSNLNISVIPELRRVNRFLGIEQDFEVNKSLEKISPALIGVYLKKPSSATPTNQIYLPSDLVTNGFILTSDGWLVSFGQVFDTNEDLVVLNNNRIYEVEKVIIDSTTGVAFIKIPANNLQVAVLGDSGDANLGQLEIVLNNLNQAVVTNIKSLDYMPINSASSLIMSSEKYSKSFLISDGITKKYLGSPLINLGGEVIGVINNIDESAGTATVTPINQFRSVMLDVLRSDIIKRVYLGIKYLDLSRVAGLSDDLTQRLDRGALVYENPLPASPAGRADVDKNDIILSVDGQLVDKNNSLTQMIQQYQPGDSVSLEILRGFQVLTREVVLSILAE